MRDSKRDTDVGTAFGLCGRGRGWDDVGDGTETCKLSHVK